MKKFDVSKYKYWCELEERDYVYCKDYKKCMYNELQKYIQCLDEIEEICKTTIFDYPINKVKVILQKIKEVKKNV